MPMNPLLKTRRPAQGGFTILEILIVFILIAGLMAFIAPKIFQQSQKANWQQAQLKLRTLAGEIEMYKLEVGRYPENLQALAKQPPGADRWNGPYAKEDELKDAWGNDYRYQVPGTNKPFDLISLGADGREGGEGENRDITN
jgi:general secretion pathway protein G